MCICILAICGELEEKRNYWELERDKQNDVVPVEREYTHVCKNKQRKIGKCWKIMNLSVMKLWNNYDNNALIM